jgi:hypothetical protein
MTYDEYQPDQDTKYVIDLITNVRAIYGGKTEVIIKFDGIYLNNFKDVICSDLRLAGSNKKKDRVIFDVVFKRFSVYEVVMAANINLQYVKCENVGEFFEFLEPEVKILFAYHFDLLEKYRRK